MFKPRNDKLLVIPVSFYYIFISIVIYPPPPSLYYWYRAKFTDQLGACAEWFTFPYIVDANGNMFCKDNEDTHADQRTCYGHIASK